MPRNAARFSAPLNANFHIHQERIGELLANHTTANLYANLAKNNEPICAKAPSPLPQGQTNPKLFRYFALSTIFKRAKIVWPWVK